jgi:hypothetical protein
MPGIRISRRHASCSAASFHSCWSATFTSSITADNVRSWPRCARARTRPPLLHVPAPDPRTCRRFAAQLPQLRPHPSPDAVDEFGARPHQHVARDTEIDVSSRAGFDGMWTDRTSVCHDALLSCCASRSSFLTPRSPTPKSRTSVPGPQSKTSYATAHSPVSTSAILSGIADVFARLCPVPQPKGPVRAAPSEVRDSAPASPVHERQAPGREAELFRWSV